MEEQRWGLGREALTYVVVGVLVFLLAYGLAEWWEAKHPSERPPTQAEQQTDLKASVEVHPLAEAPEEEPGMAQFGYDEIGTAGSSVSGDLAVCGTAYEDIEGGAVAGYTWATGAGIFPQWPSHVDFQTEATAGDWQHSLYCTYDEDTLQTSAVWVYIDTTDPDHTDEVSVAIYDGNGDLVASSGAHAVDGDGWYEVSLVTTLQRDMEYSLHAQTNKGPVAGESEIPWDVPPVSLQSSINITEDLRTGLGFNNVVSLLTDFRLGLAPNTDITIDEDIGSPRREPGDSGACYGRFKPDEDGGISD